MFIRPFFLHPHTKGKEVWLHVTKQYTVLDTITYNIIEMLTLLNLPSFYYGHKRMDMIITYIIINRLVCVPCSEFFVFNLEDQMD